MTIQSGHTHQFRWRDCKGRRDGHGELSYVTHTAGRLLTSPHRGLVVVLVVVLVFVCVPCASVSTLLSYRSRHPPSLAPWQSLRPIRATHHAGVHIPILPQTNRTPYPIGPASPGLLRPPRAASPSHVPSAWTISCRCGPYRVGDLSHAAPTCPAADAEEALKLQQHSQSRR